MIESLLKKIAEDNRSGAAEILKRAAVRALELALSIH
jgi:hypothetical protein